MVYGNARYFALKVATLNLKSYCTAFQHALKSLEIPGIVLSERMSKPARKRSKVLKNYKDFQF